MKGYLENFKALTRQYAKRQNIWHRKEEDFIWVDVMGGDSGPKRLHATVNKIVDLIRMEKASVNFVLASDEQAKMRVVNTDPAV